MTLIYCAGGSENHVLGLSSAGAQPPAPHAGAPPRGRGRNTSFSSTNFTRWTFQQRQPLNLYAIVLIAMFTFKTRQAENWFPDALIHYHGQFRQTPFIAVPAFGRASSATAFA